MAINVTGLAETAEKLIGDNGRMVDIIQLEKKSADNSKDWRAPAKATNIRCKIKDIYMVFTDADERIKVGELENVTKVATLAFNDLSGEDLTKFHTVIDEETTYSIAKAKLTKPGDIGVIWELFLEG